MSKVLGENMDPSSPPVPKHLHCSNARFEQTVLLLQGGGALGSYQAGVYQALAEANLHPDWIAGISIGAVNSALIAGNSPEKRVERLREFWEAVSTSPLGLPYFSSIAIPDDSAHSLLNIGVHHVRDERSRSSACVRTSPGPDMNSRLWPTQ